MRTLDYNYILCKWFALVFSTATSVLGLFSPGSPAYIASQNPVGHALNWVVLSFAVLGWLDLLVHDFSGKLILPRLSMRVRHHICLITYSVMASALCMRSFLAVVSEHHILAVYYMAAGVGVAAIAVMISLGAAPCRTKQ